MDREILLLVSVLLIIFSGSIVGWVNVFSLRRLRREVTSLRAQLAQYTPTHKTPAESTAPTPTKPAYMASAVPETSAASAFSPQIQTSPAPGSTFQPPVDTPPPAWLEHLKNHWMVWLGAVCVGLAGIFLAAYSIEQDYLGPKTRISLGLLTGLLLHAGAEFLRRRSSQREEASAALAGGGSVTLYAALLASVHLYELWPTGLVFLLLAAVSLGTMTLALRHGPALAVMGIAGAYAVPAVLAQDSGDIRILLGYCLVVSGAGFWLLSRVYRTWLLWLTLGGALLWWWLALSMQHDHIAILIFLVALGHLAQVLPLGLWLRARQFQDNPSCSNIASFFTFDSTISRDRVLSLVAVIGAFALTMHIGHHSYYAPSAWILMTLLVWHIQSQDNAFKLIPWLWVTTSLTGLTLGHLYWGPFWPALPIRFSEPNDVTMLYLTLIFISSYAYWLHRPRQANLYPALTLSLATLTPLLCLSVLWLLNPHGFDAWYWAAVCVGLGAFYADRARRRWKTVADAQVVWWFIAAHAAYSLAAVMAFAQAGLTLALAVQVATLAWLMQRFELPILRWLLRAVVAVILIRLTLNPWLPEYTNSARFIGDTWVFWTYGGTLLLVVLARWLATGLADLERWLEGAGLHVLVLLLAVCVRYALYDGEVFVWRYTFTEASLYTSLFAALSLVYSVRARAAGVSAPLLRWAATLLMGAAVAQYAWIAVIKNPLWQRIDLVGATPLWNILLLSYGLPVLLFALGSRFSTRELRRTLGVLAAIALWWFVTLEVRHLWQGRLWMGDNMSNGELYSYSMSWLVLAVAAMLLGSWKQHQDAYRGGMLLLVVVIAKLFLIDLSDLTGLWRVLSFMGMGLCLIGLGWVHQVMLGRRQTN